MTSAPGPHLAVGTYPNPGRHRPRLVVQRRSADPMAVIGVLSDYLIRTASVLGILAVLGVASAVGEHQAPTTGTATSTSTHHAATR